MKRVIACMVWLAAVSACERSSSTTSSAKPVSAGSAAGSNDAFTAEVHAAMTDFAAYSDRLLAVVRTHGKDCDVAATKLAELEPVFASLMPRLAALKGKMNALPQAEKDRLESSTNEMMEAFKKRNPDVEAIEQRAKECEQTSEAFAAISKKVAFTKKK